MTRQRGPSGVDGCAPDISATTFQVVCPARYLPAGAHSGDEPVPSAFSIARTRCSALSDANLREEIHAHTGSDTETSSILRSLQRFGGDLSIRYYEMTPTPSRRIHRATSAFAWTVTAVR